MNLRRSLAALLAASQLCLLLAACSEADPADTSASDDTTTAPAETTVPEETRELTEAERRALIDDGLPNQTFDGKTFRIAGLTSAVSTYIVEEQNGQSLNDILYERNMAVIDRFDINLAMTDYVDRHACRAAVQQAFTSGDAKAFDIAVYNMVDNSANALAGIYHNFYDIPYINFDQPWWADSNVDDLTINGKCFTALGDVSFNTLSGVWAYLFNKELADDLNVGDLYEVVRSGQWTLDYVRTLAASVYVDTNGDGVQNSGDTFGLGSYKGSDMNTYLWAFDNPIIKKDASGAPQYVMSTDKFPDLVTAIVELYSTGKGVYSCTGTDKTSHHTEFLNGNMLLMTGKFSTLAGFAGTAEFTVGILPYPKYDENQTNYMTMLDGGADSIGVMLLKTGDDLAFIGLVVEALCAESYKQVYPVYYDMMLKNRYADMPDDAEMIDLIQAGRVYDLGYVYDNWKGAAFWLQTLAQNNNTNVSSYMAKAWPAAQKDYDQVLALFE